MKRRVLSSLRAGVAPPMCQPRAGSSPVAVGVLTAVFALASALSAHAQFPINETFSDATSANFTLGGTASLTGTASDPGYLRLTSAIGNQAGYAILNNSFASSKGFSISFEFFSYGGSGADGISMFLVDAAGTDPAVAGQFGIGSYGGSLGYAQKTIAGNGGMDINGVSKGYLGIGIDEYGFFSNPNEGRAGGPGATPQAVALRGPGDGLAGYQYLTGSGTLPFTLSVGTARAQPGSADYRKAYIYVIPANGGYNVTVRIQHGSTVTTTTSNYAVATPPASLRVGFAGSTGSSTNIHEIRNLAILANPYAVDDEASTAYNQPVTISALANDHGIGAALDQTSVDLDPATPGIQPTYTVAGQGTFVVTNQGVVTFTPIGTFAGTVTLPYVVSDILGKESNPAIITVNVTGADVASAISGPLTGSPGAQLTYTISTRNNGIEPANNVSPTLQLPLGLSIPLSTNYAYNATTGLVKFVPVTLTVNESVDNSLIIAIPVLGNAAVAMTSSYAYPANALIPDPVASNNTATLALALVAPLPVELTSFEVVPAQGAARVTWHTATEQHNDHFTVERSVTGTGFRAVGTVRSQGSSLGPHDYSFTDGTAGQLNAETVYYRLQQVDADGTTTYGPVRSVRFTAPKATVVLYPNPSQGQTRLDLSSYAAGAYLVQVLDLTGRVLRTQRAAAEIATLDLAGLPQGAYLVLVQGAGMRQALPLLRN